MRILILTAALLPIVSAGCTHCLQTVPPTDVTAPDAGLLIRYREPGGADRSRSLSVGDADVTVTASRNHSFTVEYWGTDLDGLRLVDLMYDLPRTTGVPEVSPLLLAINKKSSCPVGALVGTHAFDPEGAALRYIFWSRATNWTGAVAQSGKINVKVE